MIRADSHAIRISDNVVIGENSVLQTVNDLPKDVPHSVNIAENVLVGDNCTLISCCIDSNVTIGSGSVVQQGAKVERAWNRSGTWSDYSCVYCMGRKSC
jgi:carbonic anhydrase/acetyltransferase-like protein (isoleucine patch superfamily)